LEGEDDMDFADGQLLRPAEVIDLLGVSRSWLYDAAKAGRIPCVRLGGPDGPVRFRACELEAWIEGSRMAPPEPRTAKRTEDTPAPARRHVEPGDGAQLRLSSDGSG
jgi:excisionase family DNA binding protein